MLVNNCHTTDASLLSHLILVLVYYDAKYFCYFTITLIVSVCLLSWLLMVIA